MLRSAALRVARRSAALAQQQRAFAEAPAVQQTNMWDDMSAMVHSDEGKRELAALRSTYLDISQKFSSMAQDVPAINWKEWSEDIDPKLVSQFKQAFDTMKLPKYEGNEAQEAKARFAELITEAEAMAANSAKRITEIEAELQNIDKEKARIATTTIDDELAADPKLAEEVDKELEKNYFMA